MTSQSTSEAGEEEASSHGDEAPVSLPQITLVDSAPASADAAITKSVDRVGIMDILSQAVQGAGLPQAASVLTDEMAEVLSVNSELQEALDQIIQEDTDLAVAEGTERTLAQELCKERAENPLTQWDGTGQVIGSQELARIQQVTPTRNVLNPLCTSAFTPVEARVRLSGVTSPPTMPTAQPPVITVASLHGNQAGAPPPYTSQPAPPQTPTLAVAAGAGPH